jgi:drug/metabolite transporter (DMT)-like permease
MVYLFLSIACIVFIGHLFKYREKTGIPIYSILMVNYIVALIISSTLSASLPAVETPIGSYLLAVSLGALFVFCYSLMSHVIERLGISLTISLSRLSLVVPTLGSIIVFSEKVSIRQIIGLMIAFAIMPISGQEIPDRSNLKRLFHGGLGWGFLLFMLFGFNDFVFKLKSELYRSVDTNSFLKVVYVVALVVSLGFILARRLPVTRRAVFLGLILGLVNYSAAFFFMQAVGALPGMLAYPLNGIAIIILTSISSSIIWREKLGLHSYVFIAGSLIAIWLIF